MKTKLLGSLLSILLAFQLSWSQVRVKDVSKVQGLHDTQLIGYGLVVGLEGTGDRGRTMFTVQSVVNMLKNLGIEIPSNRIRVRNVAAVMVTANLLPFVKKGSRVDVTVSSLGDAKSLLGGTLLMSPLQGPDGEIYAIAQGPIATGGYVTEEDHLNRRTKNHVAAGALPGGAIVQKEVRTNVLPRDQIRIELTHPDFSSAVAVAKALNETFESEVAEPEDAATIAVTVPTDNQIGGKFYEFIAEIENAQFTPQRVARVVLNEKTGTIVAGGDVTVSKVAVSHGGITIEVKSELMVSQPAPLTQGQTKVVPSTVQEITEEKPQMVVLGPTTNVSELAQALNLLGIAPRDIISIFQAIKKAGALQADLVVI